MTRVVLVHGLSGSSRWWRPVVAALEPRHDVDVVDLPRGRSLAEAVEWLAERVALSGRTALVGHSLGGLIAAHVAAARPEIVEKLVLVAPAGAAEPSTRRAHVLPLVRAVTRTRPRVLAHLTRDALSAGPRALWRSSGEAAASTIAELGQVNAPTLIVWGERDALFPAARAHLFEAAIPNARTVMLPRARHVPMLEAPQAFSATLREFLD